MEEREGATATPAVSPTPVENGESRKQVAGERGEEKPSQGGEVAASASASASALALALASAPAPAAAAEVVAAAALGMKKKRGRPRKYGPDGKLVRPLNPSPISASMPLGEYTPATAVGAVMKRGRGWLMGFGLGKPLQYGFQLESVGITTDFPIYSLISASNFSSLFFFFLLKFFAQSIICDSCEFQVVVGSFLPSYHLEQKIKKTKLENSSISTPTATIPISSTATEGAHCGGEPTHCSLMTPELNLTNATSFKGDNCAAPLHSVPDTRDSATNVGITSPGN
ncbi:hypothetical protein GW17_00047692 [Ensete ventricosum]|nr:hypothetical protein GW17_00047692 [Ensete ventricosum]